jgi:hypothetical protein
VDPGVVVFLTSVTTRVTLPPGDTFTLLGTWIVTLHRPELQDGLVVKVPAATPFTTYAEALVGNALAAPLTSSVMVLVPPTRLYVLPEAVAELVVKLNRYVELEPTLAGLGFGPVRPDIDVGGVEIMNVLVSVPGSAEVATPKSYAVDEAAGFVAPLTVTYTVFEAVLGMFTGVVMSTHGEVQVGLAVDAGSTVTLVATTPSTT